MKKQLFLCATIIVAFLSSCGPYKQKLYVEIRPNETAFVIPYEVGSKSGQEMLKSVDYLEAKKVSVKRVYIEQSKISTGRGWWDYKYIPLDTVVVVHRAPVTREWASSPGQSHSKNNQEINVESKNSIGFSIGITCTASIPEEDASKFLYYYGGRSLEDVMDHNIRSFVQDVLTREFGSRDLTQCQNERRQVFDSMKIKTSHFFQLHGIHIDIIGAAGEFTYNDPTISTAISSQFIAEKKNDAATNEVLAANKFAAAAGAIKAQKELDADITIKLAFADAVRSGRVTWPQTLVLGKEGSMMDIWGLKNMNNSPK